MSKTQTPVPRWGNEGRAGKSKAIWLTMRHLCGDEISKGTWLDVGCGSGGIAAAMAPHVDQIIGVDPEPWPEWSQLADAKSNLTLMTGMFDGEQLPVPENSTDVVICNQVYEHVGNPELLIKNIYRVLKPGGYCYFAGPNLLWPVEPHVSWPIVHWLPRVAAVRLMRMLRSEQAESLDAFSTHYWRLARWFETADLGYSNAIAARAFTAIDLNKRRHIFKFSYLFFDRIIRWLTPISPGFVFVLSKPN